MSIITYPLNGIDYDAAAAELYNSTRLSGVYANSGNLDASITDSREITIGTGIAWIQNGTFTGKVIGVTDEIVLTFDNADSVLDRIDRVVLQFDRAANASNIIIKKGTPASSPAAPVRSTTPALYELVLYDVAVNHGTTSISAADITDQRLNEDLCGLMRDGVTGLPTATLQAQVEALINELETAIEAALAGGIPAHASSHASGGSDPITPSDIGAAEPGLLVTGLTLPTSGYSGSGPYTIAITASGASTATAKRYLLMPDWSSTAATRADEKTAWNLIDDYDITAVDTLTLTLIAVPTTAVSFSLKEMV